MFVFNAFQAYDAVDDMVIAKILVPDGAEVAVGAPIMVTVEDESVVSKFADYQVDEPKPAAAAPPKEESKPKEEPKKAPKEASKETPKPKETAKEAPKTKTPEKPKEQPKAAPVTSKYPWGLNIKDSAMASIIAAEQKAYIEKYGGEAHVTIPSSK